MKIKKSRLKQLIKEELDNLSFDTEEEEMDFNEPMFRLRDEIQDAVRDAMRTIAIRELKGRVSQDKLASTVQEIEAEFEIPLMDALTPVAKGLMDEIATAKGN
jgi:predicted transcriptional regulator